MKQIITLLLLMASYSAISQTKKIAFASHSGNGENLGFAMETTLSNDNFGMAPERMITTSSLDSVIYVSEDVAVMVTSVYCKRRMDTKQVLWRPGKDTVYRHHLFSKKHSLDSIRNVLKSQYNFQNPIGEVKFIGYDNGEETYPHDPSQTFVPLKQEMHYSSMGVYGWPLLILLISSVIAALIARKLSPSK